VEELVDRLSLSYASLSPQLQRAALVVLDNPNDVAVNSMRTLATRAKVSPPTMLRLAQRMGFQNYEDFRDVFKRSVATQGYGDRADNLRRSTDKEGIAALVDATAVAAEAAFERFHDPMFSRDIERVADLIIAAERRFVLASGASFGQGISFQYVCRMALPDILLVNGFGIRAIDDIASVRAKDIVLAISTAPYSSRTVEAAIFAKQRGAEIVAVTDNRASPVAKLASASIIIKTTGPHYFPSMISLNATLEILSAVITVKLGEEAVDNISEFERDMRANGYHWEE
jgi:DNA-binding MurR/RpiR family transcriptional regulator